jgi:hypothetical protein
MARVEIQLEKEEQRIKASETKRADQFKTGEIIERINVTDDDDDDDDDDVDTSHYPDQYLCFIRVDGGAIGIAQSSDGLDLEVFRMKDLADTSFFKHCVPSNYRVEISVSKKVRG